MSFGPTGRRDFGGLFEWVNGWGVLGGIVWDAIDEVELFIFGRVLFGQWLFEGRAGDGGVFGGALFQVPRS